MSWHVRIESDESFGRQAFYIFEDTERGIKLLRINGDAQEMIDVQEGQRIAPTFYLSYRVAPEVLSAFAGQLALAGFGALRDTPVVKAKDEHSKSLEKQAERLFALASTPEPVVAALEQTGRKRS